MNATPSTPTYRQLDELAGEVLPERTVLSALAGSDAGTAPPGDPNQYVVHGDDGSTVYYACQTTHSPGSQGLMGDVGLGSPPYTTTTCMPAAVSDG